MDNRLGVIEESVSRGKDLSEDLEVLSCDVGISLVKHLQSIKGTVQSL